MKVLINNRPLKDPLHPQLDADLDDLKLIEKLHCVWERGMPREMSYLLDVFSPKDYMEDVKKEIGDPTNVAFVPLRRPSKRDEMSSEYYENSLTKYYSLKLQDVTKVIKGEKTIQAEINRSLWAHRDNYKETGMKLEDQMVQHRIYDLENPELLKNKRVFLVYDYFGNGGFIRDACVQMRQKGVNVENVFCLTGKTNGEEISLLGTDLETKTINELYQEEDIKLIEKLTGLEFSDLTYSEKKYLIYGRENYEAIRRIKETAEKIRGEEVREQIERDYRDWNKNRMEIRRETPDVSDRLKTIEGRYRMEQERRQRVQRMGEEKLPRSEDSNTGRHREGERREEQKEIVVRNDYIIDLVKGDNALENKYTTEMSEASRLLTKRKDINRETKEKIAKVLNSEKCKSVWFAEQLTPADRIAVAEAYIMPERKSEIFNLLDGPTRNLAEKTLNVFSRNLTKNNVLER